MRFLSRRIIELKNAQIALSKIRSSINNFKTLTCLIMHLIRHVAITPITKLTFLRRALQDIRFEAVMDRFGMGFLHDLDLDRGTLGNIPQDSPEANWVMRSAKTKGGPSKRIVNSAPDSIFPLGHAPSWHEVVETMANNPGLLLKPWVWDGNWDNHRRASFLFVKFTVDMWITLNETHVEIPVPHPETLRDAMEIWTYPFLATAFKSTIFVATNHGLEGSIPGKRTSSFRDMVKIYFPPPDTNFHKDSPWKKFAQSGYILLYHQALAGANEQFQRSLDQALSLIFNRLQCLPHSRLCEGRPGDRIWSSPKGCMRFLTNPIFYKLQKIGPAAKKRELTVRMKANPLTIAARLDAEHKAIPLQMAKRQQRLTQKAQKAQKQANIANARAQRQGNRFRGELSFICA